jgi:hypothetical protein
MSHLTTDRTAEDLLICRVPTGATFEHYKGKRYKILGVGRHTETLGMCVVYQSLYDCKEFGDHAVWVRPLEMFLETIVIDGKEMPRFRRVDNE